MEGVVCEGEKKEVDRIRSAMARRWLEYETWQTPKFFHQTNTMKKTQFIQKNISHPLIPAKLILQFISYHHAHPCGIILIRSQTRCQSQTRTKNNTPQQIE